MKIILMIVGFAFLVGCASISVDPQTGEINYYRIGDQHIKGFEMTNKDTKIKFEGQQSNADALSEAIKVIGVLAPVK